MGVCGGSVLGRAGACLRGMAWGLLERVHLCVWSHCTCVVCVLCGVYRLRLYVRPRGLKIIDRSKINQLSSGR